jgi:predicted peroxiredoxin
MARSARGQGPGVPHMPDVNIIIASADGRRLYSALEAAIAWAALGKSVRVFFQGESVALLRAPIAHAGDEARRAAGQPDLAWLINEAAEMGVTLIVCQTGLAVVGMAIADADALVQAGGLIGFLADVPPGTLPVVY